MSTSAVAAPPTFRAGQFRYYDLFVSLFVVALVISNLVGQKICDFGTLPTPFGPWHVRVSGAQLLFPLTYIFGDIFTEVYGYAASRRAIWLGFLASGLLSLMSWIVVKLPPAPDFANQAAFEAVFGIVPRFVLASLVAYLCGEFANSFVLAKLKVWTGGRHLWTRTISSTVVGQFVDTTILILIAFGGRTSTQGLLELIAGGYFGKVAYEVLATPLTYAVVNFLKRREGVDVFDRQTDFSPFHLG